MRLLKVKEFVKITDQKQEKELMKFMSHVQPEVKWLGKFCAEDKPFEVYKPYYLLRDSINTMEYRDSIPVTEGTEVMIDEIIGEIDNEYLLEVISERYLEDMERITENYLEAVEKLM